LLLQGLAWLLGSSITGLLFRVLAPFGYYPRMAWWNFFSAIVGSAASVTAVVRGAGLLEVGLVSTGTTVVLSIPLYFDLLRLVRKERIPFSPPSWQIAKTNFLLSLALSGKILLDNMRQQGVRIVLAPLSGLAGLAAFSTMRTGANGALQGLNSITQPLMPDLVRFLQQRDQARSESAFGTIWLLVIAVMAPAAVVLQALVEPIYLAWTRGQIPFNPGLFALLSLSVLVYAVVQPAMTVVVGNNLLKPQLALSVLGALIMVGGMFILVPATGILGAGLALLAAEIATTLGYKIVAQRWLHQNGLQWPGRSFRIALSSVVIAATAMALMLWLPRAKWFILAGSLSFFWVNVRRYWLVLPAIATQHTLRLISKLPGLRGLAPG
jgi:O-antigen/teichoic acid export membrane protein